MKRFLYLTAVAIVVVTMGVIFAPVEAVKPTGTSISGSFKWTQLVDSTVAVQYDTFTTPTNSNSNLFLFTALDDYSTATGHYVIEYEAVDTSAGGVAVDTTKDTVVVQIWTASDGLLPYTLVWTDTMTAFHPTATVVNGDYSWFDVSDSVQGDVLYVSVISILQDSVSLKAVVEAGIDYKLTYKLNAK